ncbi:MAG: AAA-like domain-containing protein [Rivularia sp. (in: cyanobacteria)]
MSIDELIQLLESYFESGLDSLQKKILRCCSEGKSYRGIAAETQYEEEQIKAVASNLWQILSDIKKQPINESNFGSSFDLNSTQIQQGSGNKKSIQVSSEFPNGPVPIDSKLYISRPLVEELAYAEIAQPGSFICVKAPRKMGKTSLNLRILNHAANLGYKNVSLDFQQADKAIFTSLDKFLRWFCANISRELGLKAQLDDYWDEEMGSKVSCSVYFEAYLLSSLESAVVIVLNEVDLVFEHREIAADFLPLLRSWYEQGKRVDIWQKLRLVLTYSTEIIVPLKLSQSPFNVGLPLRLFPFTKEQVQDLAARHNLTWMDERNISRLMEMVGGHPYLVRLALYHLALDGEAESLELLLQQAPTEAGIYNSHLRRYVSILQENLQLKSVFCELIEADCAMKFDPLVTYKLQSMGLIKLEGDYASVACELYRLYFRRQLCDSNNSIEELPLNADLDLLTQLITRHAFETCLQELWQNYANRKGELSLILCDIDHFKLYNKTYGEAAGDNCLQQIANVIREYVSSLNTANQNETLVARYAGEKFGVLMSVNETIALTIAQNIREKIQALAISCQYPGIGGLPAEVITVSIGVASIKPYIEVESTRLVEMAEQALYQAKRKGRNWVVVAQK